MRHLKQWHILWQKLGHVDIHQGSQQQHVFVLIGVLKPEISGCSQHRLHSSHTIIIVVLRGQLLRAQTIRSHDFLGETVDIKLKNNVCE